MRSNMLSSNLKLILNPMLLYRFKRLRNYRRSYRNLYAKPFRHGSVYTSQELRQMSYDNDLSKQHSGIHVQLKGQNIAVVKQGMSFMVDRKDNPRMPLPSERSFWTNFNKDLFEKVLDSKKFQTNL